MPRDRFIDQLPDFFGGLGTYDWPINHSDEDDSGTSTSAQRTAPVAGMGFVYQMSESSPLVFRWKGTLLHRSQLQKMWAFYGICNGWGPGSQRTFQLEDFTGALFEVLFTAFNPVRERVAYNPKAESAGDRLIKWTYTAEFSVITPISGWP